jgi:hypothetical protein
MIAGVPARTTSHMAINGEWVGAVSGQFFAHCIRAPAEHRPQSHHDCEAVAWGAARDARVSRRRIRRYGWVHGAPERIIGVHACRATP